MQNERRVELSSVAVVLSPSRAAASRPGLLSSVAENSLYRPPLLLCCCAAAVFAHPIRVVSVNRPACFLY